MKLSPMTDVLAAIASGKPVVVQDDADRENEGDIIFAAQYATAELVNFCVRHARGLVCVALAPERADRLGLQPAPVRGRAAHYSPFTWSVEAATGVSTGISASDRARTIRVLAGPDSGPDDLVTPGHVFPLRARKGGLAVRRGHTEAGVALARLAGCEPAAVLCEIMAPDGDMLRGDALGAFARQHGFPLTSVAEIARHLDGNVTRVAESTIPTTHGVFRVAVYQDGDGKEHLVLSHPPRPGGGQIDNAGKNGAAQDSAAPLVRLHSECLTGDALGSHRCDCGDQLERSMARISSEDTGMIVYLRQEGRGIGLGNKIRAYALQDKGMDTVEANTCLGFEPDERTYDVAAGILRQENIPAVRLLTNNPAKVKGLREAGIRVVAREALATSVRPENEHYLRTKIDRMDHSVELINE
ncbi:MAG: bifunctional 3,4-dihydroxy-2-butanone-4-phosphate synthase/GTP cyclohydrolase II [Bacteroidetes bacterium CG12_big_fil_rev_8_21_14_0_65_60_17]|nr:MAG: bifunctional 3,4-dihydroxy-2-butanone-4-phosphate synthase/GTP cyclohydrolase II [Bacteroidetes bacterium CG12_big_fil_rev_8_21_14_0_65_60_17]